MPELEFHISFFKVTAMGGEHITTALDIPAPAAAQWYQLSDTNSDCHAHLIGL